MAIYVALALLTTVALLYAWLQTGSNTYRLDALKRVVWGVPYFGIMFLVGSAFGAILVVTFVLDVVWQLATGREGFTPEGDMQRLWEWRDHNTRYLVYGDGGGFKLLP